MSRLGIELGSVFSLPPVEHVTLAADLGCRSISTGLERGARNPLGYPFWSLRNDPALRREMIAAMHDRGVSIALGEGGIISPTVDVRDYARDLDLMAELGAERIGTRSMEPDRGRTLEQFTLLVEMVEQRGIRMTTLEFAPPHTIPNLAAAVFAIEQVGKPSFRLLIDVMHLFRSGGTAADLTKLPTDLIAYAQICDARRIPEILDYMKEATTERLVPGAGEIPLQEIFAALPRHIPIGVEVPMLKSALAGAAPHERLGPCVEAARRLLP